MYRSDITYWSLLFFLISSLALTGCSLREADQINSDPFEYIPEALSDYTMKITTQSQNAQNYFDQGLHLGYAFGRGDARRSFLEAQKLDSTCSMCYWGEAWSRGPYLNNHNQMQNGAYEAAVRAKSLADAGFATEVEEDIIHALLVRYNEENSLENREELDRGYAAEMEKVYQKYPGNQDVATLYAEALFQLEPRRGYRDIEKESIQKLLGVLEEVIEDNILHPGACHFYIHAVEATQEPELGLPCADRIKETMPGGSHILHMSSHIFNQVGEWDRSVRANLEARHIDRMADKNRGFAIYPGHNLTMAAYSASMIGQSSIALQAARDQQRYYGDEALLPLIKLRFGRFEEIRNIENEPEGEVEKGLWLFTKGYAALKTGDRTEAERFLGLVQDLAQQTDDNYRVHSGRDLLAITGAILEGEILRMDGLYEEAKTAFETAVSIYDELEYSEPETLPFSPRHWVGALLLDMEKYEDAESVYRAELEHHPKNGWALYGFKKALEVQNKDYTEVQTEFEKSWSRADVWIERSHY